MHIQPLQDRYLSLGVLVLVLVDVIILLVYTTVEGVQRNLTAIRVPNRESLMNVEGVGWYMHVLQLAVSLLYTLLFSLNSSYVLDNISTLSASISLPRNVKL